MDLLKREIAPVIPEAWRQIDDEARSVFHVTLAGRKVVDFDGPHGWGLAAHNTGKLDLFEQDPVEGVGAGLRRVRPLVELRAPIVLSQMELDTAGRGALVDLEPVAEAAKRIALAEDHAIFNGWPEAGILGIVPASPHAPIRLGPRGSDYPGAVVEATTILADAGIEGPYTLVLGTREHNELSRATGEGGYPVRQLVEKQLVTGPVVHAPALSGGLLLSTRGKDFILHVGQDLSIGYADHDRTRVELYLTESFTFSVIAPDAAVPLAGDS